MEKFSLLTNLVFVHEMEETGRGNFVHVNYILHLFCVYTILVHVCVL